MVLGIIPVPGQKAFRRQQAIFNTNKKGDAIPPTIGYI
jgi:hypothetical protein